MIPLGDDNSDRRTIPYINYTIIALNVLVFFMELGQGGDAQLQAFFDKWCVIPVEYAKHTDLPPLAPGPYWITIFSSMFMHGGWMHLIGNMLYLWIFGDNIEDRWGHIRYLIAYLFFGVAATLAHIVFNLHSTVPSLGASGAISGVLGAYLVYFPRNKIRVLVFRVITTLPAYWVLGGWIVLQLFSQIGEIGNTTTSSGVAYMAHIGGFAAGIIVAFLFRGQSAAQAPSRLS